mmetsp:Transcript_33735/g.100637  ORF Transcript_33735/g.100637 Transcript_33735/m.100637 type:complete len:234 (+) Transcript_33735:458-1159(+)
MCMFSLNIISCRLSWFCLGNTKPAPLAPDFSRDVLPRVELSERQGIPKHGLLEVFPLPGLPSVLLHVLPIGAELVQPALEEVAHAVPRRGIRPLKLAGAVVQRDPRLTARPRFGQGRREQIYGPFRRRGLPRRRRRSRSFSLRALRRLGRQHERSQRPVQVETRGEPLLVRREGLHQHPGQIRRNDHLRPRPSVLDLGAVVDDAGPPLQSVVGPQDDDGIVRVRTGHHALEER